MNKSLTPWFSGVAPTRPGVYEVRLRASSLPYGRMYARWNGSTWFVASWQIMNARFESMTTIRGDHWHKVGKWRGLAKKP
jgi:hypothetical protein